jgi:hypothetical protein
MRVYKYQINKMMKLYNWNILNTLLAVMVGILSSGCESDPSQSVSAVTEADRISVQVNGEEFTSYLFGSDHKYLFFYPVIGPLSGKSITTWGQEPYPHQSSIAVSLDWVKSENVERANYWAHRHELETGQVVSLNPRIVENDGKKVVLKDDTEWIVPKTGTRHFHETKTVTIWAPSATVRVMDFEFDFDVLKDLSISPTGHAFFLARVNSEIAVGCEIHGPEWAHLGTGTIVDSEGNRNEEETREKYSDWMAFYGQHNGVTEGLAIIQHPDNSYYPDQWVTRDYGIMSASSFTYNKEPVEMHAGQKLFFKYRVVVFSGDHEEADIAGWHRDFLNQ